MSSCHGRKWASGGVRGARRPPGRAQALNLGKRAESTTERAQGKSSKTKAQSRARKCEADDTAMQSKGRALASDLATSQSLSRFMQCDSTHGAKPTHQLVVKGVVLNRANRETPATNTRRSEVVEWRNAATRVVGALESLSTPTQLTAARLQKWREFVGDPA